MLYVVSVAEKAGVTFLDAIQKTNFLAMGLRKLSRAFYFRETFVKIKPSKNGEITMSFTDVSKKGPCSEFNVKNTSFNAIHDNKILAKISKFSVFMDSEESDQPWKDMVQFMKNN